MNVITMYHYWPCGHRCMFSSIDDYDNCDHHCCTNYSVRDSGSNSGVEIMNFQVLVNTLRSFCQTFFFAGLNHEQQSYQSWVEEQHPEPLAFWGTIQQPCLGLPAGALPIWACFPKTFVLFLLILLRMNISLNSAAANYEGLELVCFNGLQTLVIVPAGRGKQGIVARSCREHFEFQFCMLSDCTLVWMLLDFAHEHFDRQILSSVLTSRTMPFARETTTYFGIFYLMVFDNIPSDIASLQNPHGHCQKFWILILRAPLCSVAKGVRSLVALLEALQWIHSIAPRVPLEP